MPMITEDSVFSTMDDGEEFIEPVADNLHRTLRT